MQNLGLKVYIYTYNKFGLEARCPISTHISTFIVSIYIYILKINNRGNAMPPTKTERQEALRTWPMQRTKKKPQRQQAGMAATLNYLGRVVKRRTMPEADRKKR